MNQELTPQEKSKFLERAKTLTDEALTDVYLKQADYQPRYVDIVKTELESRGFVLKELTSLDKVQQVSLEKKTDEELIEIFVNSDRHKEDLIKLVEREMKKRNLSIENFETEQQENKTILREGMQGGDAAIAWGYILSLLTVIIGPIIAINYAFSKEKNEDGEKYYKYNKATRNHGKRMLILFAIVLVFIFIITIIENI